MIAIIVAIIRKTGELFYWYVWLFMLAVSVFLLTIFPIYIQPLFNKFTPLDEIVEDESKKWVSISAYITHSLTQSITHSLNHSLTHSLTHSYMFTFLYRSHS